MSIDRRQLIGGCRAPRSPRSWRRRCRSPPLLTRRLSPGSTGSSASERSGWSAARSAPARRSPPAPRPRCSIAAGTQSSICPTRRSAHAGSTPSIVRALGATPRFYRATLIPQATSLLAAETAERGKTVVLICDEAHLLSAEQLEELRMLTNSEMDSRATFACLLSLGQPTLRRKLRQGVFAALDQRISLRCTIDGMDRKETGEYIAHHIKLAGRSDTLFSDDAVALIDEASRGLPRQVNNLATQTLIAAFATGKSICDESSARAAVAEILSRMTGEMISLFDQQPSDPATGRPASITLPAPAAWPEPPAADAFHGLPGAIVE